MKCFVVVDDHRRRVFGEI